MAMQSLWILALFFGTVFGEVTNNNSTGHQLRSSFKGVDCGVCKNVPESTCKWCDGAGGNAPVNSRPNTPDYGSPSASSGGCPAGLVNCGVCRCTTRSACNYCDGSGGPARVTSDAWSIMPSCTMLLVAFVIGS